VPATRWPRDQSAIHSESARPGPAPRVACDSDPEVTAGRARPSRGSHSGGRRRVPGNLKSESSDVRVRLRTRPRTVRRSRLTARVRRLGFPPPESLPAATAPVAAEGAVRRPDCEPIRVVDTDAAGSLDVLGRTQQYRSAANRRLSVSRTLKFLHAAHASHMVEAGVAQAAAFPAAICALQSPAKTCIPPRPLIPW
jgi:hypothetical protein